MDDALAAVVARLYAVPPEEFVAVRAAEVARARQARDTRLAAAVGKLRKPTVAAWLVNLLAHERPDLVGELLELGEQLRDAQRELRGGELRELSVRRRSTVAALAREAARLAGPDRGNLPLPEVENTFAAALADATVAAAVQQGALTKSLEYTGFGETPRPQLRLVQGGEDTPRTGTVTAKRSAPTQDDREQRAEARRREEERRRAEEERARAVRQARRELMTALQQLSDAETAKAEAERAVAAAGKAIASAEKRVKIAQDALADLS
ncbi:TolC family protein [Dactylosporangium aurantiacum]|uniref:TolC family protein n=1 Tax=Dactylosporangium aurantiacum TaxID=35754 RepID=A0A9Q9IG97_9ACTN|nr:TolC family protein [Dactylosporangium aurantiacum]MDG6110219.1 TolC family protein [Dactylosporangium aurantiacum]UWZ55502.1 TolC family protein [Dactylosporangium aurantiacum]